MSSRRRRRQELGLAFLISLLVNHGLLLPVAYFLFTSRPAAIPEQPAPLDVELVPPAALPDEPAPPPRPQLAPKPRQRVAVARPPEQKKAEEKKSEQPKPPEQKKAEEKQAQPVPQPKPERRLKMVEAPNPETEQPPENARFLSDKNRRVEQETRATHTNLEKEHPKPAPSEEPKAPRARQPGSDRPKIAETREQKGKKKARQPKQEKISPLMAMRAQAAQPGKEEQKALAEKAPEGSLTPGQAAQAERKAMPGQMARKGLNLDYRSQDRIDGQEAVKARELARLSPSVSKGGSSHEKKWAQVRAALENFIPEVRPGNQTALGTRADPFALYIARMHRKIHKFWGFGFLVDLDAKPDSNPMNDMSLWTMIEIVVSPAGKVEKATIVRPSGLLTFDVAALDTVFTASPYENPPRAIRSADGRVYMHWRFHRDQRQCGTFGVDPFILTTPPKGPIDNPATEVTGENTAGGGERQLRKLHRRSEPPSPQRYQPAPAGSEGRLEHEQEGKTVAPVPATRKESAPATRLDPDDPKAMAVTERFLQAFGSRNPERMAAACGLPFRAGSNTVAKDRAELARMFRDLLSEAAGKAASGPSRLLTVAQARGRLGRLPAGVDPGDSVLLGLATLGTTPVTLIVEKSKHGWQLVGLNR